jgi:hypothetical protein
MKQSRADVVLAIAIAAFCLGSDAAAQPDDARAAAVRDRNAAVMGKSLGMAIELYLESREARTGRRLGALVCNAKLNTGRFPVNDSSSTKATEAVAVERRAPCGSHAGFRSASGATIRIDSVSYEIHPGVPVALVYATIRDGSTTFLEVAELHTVGVGRFPRWTLIDIRR